MKSPARCRDPIIAHACREYGAHLPPDVRRGLILWADWMYPEGHVSKDLFKVVFGEPDTPEYRQAIIRLVNRMHIGVKHPQARRYVQQSCRDMHIRCRQFLLPIFIAAMADVLKKIRVPVRVRFGRKWLVDDHGHQRTVAPGWTLNKPEFWKWLQLATYGEVTRTLLGEKPEVSPPDAAALARAGRILRQLPKLLKANPSKQQKQILRLLKREPTVAAVARKLGRSASSLRTQLWRLRSRLGVEAGGCLSTAWVEAGDCPFCGGRIVHRKCRGCGVVMAVGISLDSGRCRRAKREKIHHYTPTKWHPNLGQFPGDESISAAEYQRLVPVRPPSAIASDWVACIRCSKPVKTSDPRPLCPECANKPEPTPYTRHVDSSYWDDGCLDPLKGHQQELQTGETEAKAQNEE